MVAVSEPDGSLAYVNGRWLDYTGLTFEQLDGDRAAFVHPDDLPAVRAAREEALRSRTPLSIDYRVRRSDGEYRWHVWHAVPVFGDDGALLRLIGTTTDIHDRKREQEHTVQEQARFQLLAESIPAIVSVSRPDGSLDYFNQLWYAYTGLPEGMPSDEEVQSVFHPDDFPQVQRLWRHALRQGDAYSLEFRIRRADGAWRWHFGRVAPLRDERGAITLWMSTSIDIEDRKRAEEQLRASEERFRRLVETANEGVWLISPETTTAYVNQRMAAMLGYTPQEMIGRGLM
jgi:PAS domain S-box-containing protein